jgi:hypothetical protein
MNKHESVKITALSILESLHYKVIKVEREYIDININGRGYSLAINDVLEIKGADDSDLIILEMRLTGISLTGISPTLYYSVNIIFDMNVSAVRMTYSMPIGPFKVPSVEGGK